jgi:DNA adenine methylase
MFFNIDFEDLINNIAENEDFFVFIDPPYYNTDQNLIYTHGFNKEDHLRLAKVLTNSKFKFLLTYDNCKEVKELYKDFIIVDHLWNYKMSRTDDQKNDKSSKDGIKNKRSNEIELFIMNYNTKLSYDQMGLKSF